MNALPPFLPFYIGALLVATLPARARPWFVLLTPVGGALNLFLLFTSPQHAERNIYLLEYTLQLVAVDKLSLLFGLLFHIAALLGVIYAWHVRERTQQLACLLYAGSALGAVFAGDLITLFLFWEMLAVTSVFLIWARRTPRAVSAGMRYLVIQVFSGVLLFGGAIVHAHRTGSIAFDAMTLDNLGGVLIFIAFGIKCGFPLLHNWLTDSYPEATPSGTVFLSAFTTKVAVYALARGFAGTEMLILIGTVMTCFPIFYAVIENDLRRVLAYSMLNQIGFMVVGIGIGTELALNGAVAHAFNDVIFKGLLMMSMGAVLYRTGKMNGSDLGGLYKSMPKTTVLCIVGAASISAFPLFSGFVSKSMVMAATLQEGHGWIWLALLFASAGVFHHAGIKIPFFAFFAHDSGVRCQEAPTHMLIAMTLAAVLCVLVGCWPWLLYQMLPFASEYRPFDATHVLAQVQLLFFSALAFAWLKLSGIYPPELPSVNVDAEWVYRRAAPRALRQWATVITRLDRAWRTAVLSYLHRLAETLQRWHAPGHALGLPGISAAMVVAALLGAMLVFYYAI